MIDLHTHTNYSDGTWNLTKLLEEAEKSKIEILSITDHDTIDSYIELENMNIKEKYSGKIIPGIEFSTVFDGVMFHLLAYDFDYRKLRAHIDWEQNNDILPIDSELLRIREERFLKTNLLHMRYDEETFNWRMRSESGIKSFTEPKLGYVLYKIGHRGMIVEVELGEIFLYEYTENAFKKMLKAFNKCIKPDILWVMVSEGHPLRRFYSKSWFLTNPKQKYLHHGVRVETDEMKEICYNPMNWAISSLDIDTF